MRVRLLLSRPVTRYDVAALILIADTLGITATLLVYAAAMTLIGRRR